MKNLPEKPLQEAIFDLLSGDMNLMAMVEGVYDIPPANIDYPYIAFGRINSRDWSTHGTAGVQSLIVLHIYSQASRKEVLMIRDRVLELLHDNPLTLPNHNLIMMRFEHNEVDMEDNGLMYHGIIRYRAFIETLAA